MVLSEKEKQIVLHLNRVRAMQQLALNALFEAEVLFNEVAGFLAKENSAEPENKDEKMGA